MNQQGLLKILLGFLAIASMIVVALFASVWLQDWRFNSALAAAEAWNETEWGTGDAIRLTLLTETSQGEATEKRETQITCYRKRLVSTGDGFLAAPVTRTSYQARLFQHALSVGTEDRMIRALPSSALCTKMFQEGPPASLPTILTGDVVVMDLSENTSRDDNNGTRIVLPAKTCRIDWSTGRPLSMEGNVTLAPIKLLAVDRPPLREVFEDASGLGSARAVVETLVNRTLGRNDRPNDYVWSQVQQCWVPNGGERCVAEADDICGLPKL